MMKNTLRQPHIIGRKAYIDFPTFGLSEVPAKVDTGADSSAIWASDIVEKNGTLSFVLFDNESPFYTGEKITSKDFKIISVKNSFGTTEFRYKTKILTRLEGRDIKVQFTLADRSNSSQPVLIGRRTLQGKFLVDVAVDPDKDKKRKVLFVSARPSDNVKLMTDRLQDLMADTIVERTTYDDMIFSVIGGIPSIYIDNLEHDLDEYDLVHFKTSVQRDITAAFSRYAHRRGVRVLDPTIQNFPTTSKLYEYSIIVDHGVKVPDSVFVTPKRLVKSYALFARQLGLPFVLKGIHSSKGEINDVVRDEGDFDRIAKAALRHEQYLIGQRFVPNDGDFRVLTMGKQIKLVIHRVRLNDLTHLNNTSVGGTATLVEPNALPSDIQIKCVELAHLMGRDIAGVDMVQDNVTKEWYCFEVNDGPQLATGAFKEEKHNALAEYLERELEK